MPDLARQDDPEAGGSVKGREVGEGEGARGVPVEGGAAGDVPKGDRGPG